MLKTKKVKNSNLKVVKKSNYYSHGDGDGLSPILCCERCRPHHIFQCLLAAVWAGFLVGHLADLFKLVGWPPSRLRLAEWYLPEDLCSTGKTVNLKSWIRESTDWRQKGADFQRVVESWSSNGCPGCGKNWSSGSLK